MPDVARAFADVSIDDDEMTVTVHGRDPIHIRLPFARSGDREWLEPTHSFT